MSDSGSSENRITDIAGRSGKSSFDPVTGLWNGVFENRFARYSSILIIVIVIAAGVVGELVLKGATISPPGVLPPKGSGHNRSILMINGNRNDLGVVFKHEWHKGFLGDEDSCEKCHHINKPGDRNTACWKCHVSMEDETLFFNHTLHIGKLGDNQSCTQCHDPEKPRWQSNSRQCLECHEEDMGMSRVTRRSSYLTVLGYMDAMHGMCVECHKEKGSETGRTEIAECSNCHGDDEVSLP